MIECLMHDSTLDTREHFAEPAHVKKSGRGIGTRRAQQDVIGLMAAQHVVDEIGRNRQLAARFFLAREPAFDQAGDDRAIAEGAFHQRRFGKPGFEIIAEHILIEQSGK